MKVLVADGDGALAAAGVVFLSMWGHEVAVATDGLDALRKARAWKPDVVVAEMRLARMDGVALTAAIGTSAETHATRVVVSCRPGDDHLRRIAEGLGAAACVGSPIDVGELGRVLARLAGPNPRDGRRRRGTR